MVSIIRVISLLISIRYQSVIIHLLIYTHTYRMVEIKFTFRYNELLKVALESLKRVRIERSSMFTTSNRLVNAKHIRPTTTSSESVGESVVATKVNTSAVVNTTHQSRRLETSFEYYSRTVLKKPVESKAPHPAPVPAPALTHTAVAVAAAVVDAKSKTSQSSKDKAKKVDKYATLYKEVVDGGGQVCRSVYFAL